MKRIKRKVPQGKPVCRLTDREFCSFETIVNALAKAKQYDQIDAWRIAHNRIVGDWIANTIPGGRDAFSGAMLLAAAQFVEIR